MNRKVLIVDDEILVRIGIKHSVDWEKHSFEVVGEASDGKLCLEMAEKYKPDLIILDINMPEISGIEVLKELKKRSFRGKVIILTCYEELEYARQAMKYGASDYVLKTSINENGLLASIKELSFDKKDTAPLADDELVHEVLEEREIGRILDGYDMIDESIISVSPYNLFCIVGKIHDMEKIQVRYAKKKMDIFYSSLNSILKQALSKYREYSFLQYKLDTFVAFISFTGNSSAQKVYLHVRQLVQHLKTIVEGYLAVDMNFGVSSAKFKIADMKAAYDEALTAISEKFIFPRKNIFYFSESHAGEGAAVKSGIVGKLEKDIMILVLDRDYETVLEQLSRYFEFVMQEKIADAEKIKDFICDIVRLMEFGRKDWKERYGMEIRAMESLEEIEEAAYAFLDKYLHGNDNGGSNYLVRRAEEYIRENYNKNISLRSISEYLELSESYTSRLFNKYKGVTIPTFLNTVRIEYAKERLKNTNKKIYEIAQEAGYMSATAFHIAFKKAEGVTPIEYRNMNQ